MVFKRNEDSDLRYPLCVMREGYDGCIRCMRNIDQVGKES